MIIIRTTQSGHFAISDYRLKITISTTITRPVQTYVKNTHIKALCHTPISMAVYDMILLRLHMFSFSSE